VGSFGKEENPRVRSENRYFKEWLFNPGAIKVNRRTAEGFKRTTAVSKKESPTLQDTRHRQRTDGEEKMTFLPETRESRRLELEL
jgi:hypothetical protein